MAKKTKIAPKLPKAIAGVTVPKQLRKAGGLIVKAAKDPMVIDLAVAALAAAGAAMAENRKAGRAKKSVGRAVLAATVGTAAKKAISRRK